jgi:CheY-like chemotaxis protein
MVASVSDWRIARHLIEQHEGDIHATSDGPGLGTTVHIRLPISADTDDANDPVPVDLEFDEDFRMPGMTVLVVDDQQDSCELLAALFERHGARVVQCDSAESALGVLSDVEANLLIADIAMPDIDGYELIRRVRISTLRFRRSRSVPTLVPGPATRAGRPVSTVTAPSLSRHLNCCEQSEA